MHRLDPFLIAWVHDLALYYPQLTPVFFSPKSIIHIFRLRRNSSGFYMIHIITGSTLGGAEYVGDHLSDLLQAQGKETTIHNQPQLAEIPAQGTWLIITSTHGAGDYPDNIQPFIQALQATPPNTRDLTFAVVAIGDSSYDTFCAAGQHAFDLLEDIGATPLADCFTIDVQEYPVPEDAAEVWLNERLAAF